VATRFSPRTQELRKLSPRLPYRCDEGPLDTREESSTFLSCVDGIAIDGLADGKVGKYAGRIFVEVQE